MAKAFDEKKWRAAGMPAEVAALIIELQRQAVRASQPGPTGKGIREVHFEPVTGAVSIILSDGSEYQSPRLAGKSSYEQAVEQGYTGTIEDWIEDQKGPPGEVSQAQLDQINPKVSPKPRRIPLFRNDRGRVPVWLTGGLIDGLGLSPSLRADAVKNVVENIAPTGRRKPLMGLGRKVLIWADRNGVQFAGGQGASRPDYKARTVTDGRSLNRWRSKLARIDAGEPGAKAKIALIGDSYVETVHIPQALRAGLGKIHPITGDGFQSGYRWGSIGPYLWTTTGWEDIDGSAVSNFPYGAGPDGHCIHTDSTTATMTLDGTRSTEMRIYHLQHGGTWRWRVDGGQYNEVVADNSGTQAIVTISGLEDAPHKLEIDTQGNAGRVVISGVYLTRDTPGIEVLKLGNGGTTGYRVQSYAQYLAGPIADMKPDVAAIILGTNDYQSTNSPPEVYIQALAEVVAVCRAAVPDMGFVFVIPPTTDGTVRTPLSKYRNALWDWAIPQGHEVISFLDRWGTYETSLAQGLFRDALHVGELGASVFVAEIINKLLRA